MTFKFRFQSSFFNFDFKVPVTFAKLNTFHDWRSYIYTYTCRSPLSHTIWSSSLGPLALGSCALVIVDEGSRQNGSWGGWQHQIKAHQHQVSLPEGVVCRQSYRGAVCAELWQLCRHAHQVPAKSQAQPQQGSSEPQALTIGLGGVWQYLWQCTTQ